MQLHMRITSFIPLLFQIIDPATSLPASPPTDSLSLELALPALLNVSSNGNCANPSRYPTWRSSRWIKEDCYAAVQDIYIRDVLQRRQPDERFEFVDRFSPGTTDFSKAMTPRKYTSGTCVLTVMMLERFRPGTLPNGPRHSKAKTDVSTYRIIAQAAKGIEHACTETRTPGWAMVGVNSAMGVFIWPTDSEINRMTPGFPAYESTVGLKATDDETLEEALTS